MQRRTIRLAAGIAVAVLTGLTTGPLLAHHSFAMYDRSTQYVFTGVVQNLNPASSHLQILFVPLNDARDALVRDAVGERVTWSVEMEGAAASAREGISASNFTRGTVFSVSLTPLRNGEPGGARVDALFKCPEGEAPEPGKHCDSVAGSTRYGEGELASPTDVWEP